MNMYQNMYQNPYQTQNGYQYIQQKPSNGITWVQGIEGAKGYQLQPNSNVLLLDSEEDRFYIKTSDNIGMCNLRTFEFKEVTGQQSVQKENNYVTREEVIEIINSLKGEERNGKQFVQSNKQQSNK